MQCGEWRNKEARGGKESEKVNVYLTDSFWHGITPGDFEAARGYLPGLTTIMRHFDPSFCTDSLGGAEDDVFRIVRIEPQPTTITIVQQSPGCSAVRSAIQAAPPHHNNADRIRGMGGSLIHT